MFPDLICGSSDDGDERQPARAGRTPPPKGVVATAPPPFVASGLVRALDMAVPREWEAKNERVLGKCAAIPAAGAPDIKRLRDLSILVVAVEAVLLVAPAGSGKEAADEDADDAVARHVDGNLLSDLPALKPHCWSLLLTEGSLQIKRPANFRNLLPFVSKGPRDVTASPFDLRGLHVGASGDFMIVVHRKAGRNGAAAAEPTRYSFLQTPHMSSLLSPLASALAAA